MKKTLLTILSMVLCLSMQAATVERVQEIIVTYAGDAGDEDGISSVRSDMDGDGVMYNIGGQRVSDSYRGIVIVNGRKILKK